MKNNPQKILLFIFTTFLLLGCLTFVFLYKKINDNNQQIQQNTTSLQIEAHRRDEIASLDRVLQTNAPNRILLESHFIKSSDVVPFFNMIEMLGVEAGVSSKIYSVDAKVDNSSLMVNLNVSGRFEAIYKFLTLLENSPYVLDFVSMDIHKISSSVTPDKNVNDASWEAVFKIQLLSFIP